MDDIQQDRLHKEIQLNQQSKDKVVEAAEELHEVKKSLCNNEFPQLISKLRLVQHLPEELHEIIDSVEESLCSDMHYLSTVQRDILKNILGESLLKKLLQSDNFFKGLLLALSSIFRVGATPGTGSIFHALSKKKSFKEKMDKRLVVVEDSTTTFNNAILSMESLLDTVEEERSFLQEGIESLSDKKRNYENLTIQEKEELYELATRMKNLAEELMQQIEV